MKTAKIGLLIIISLVLFGLAWWLLENSLSDRQFEGYLSEEGQPNYPATSQNNNQAVMPPVDNKTLAQIMTEIFVRKYPQPESDVEVKVETESGSFAKGTVNFAGQGGAVWFAVKTVGNWELVYAGNGIVACTDLDKYNFPKELAPQCLGGKDNGVLIKR